MIRMKKILTAIVFILACMCLLPPAAADAKTKAYPYSGTCGENATWHLDKKGKLTISGTGAVTEAGWRSVCKELDKDYGEYSGSGERKLITSIVIADGITEIGEGIFFNCGIQKLRVPDSVKKIGKSAFVSCSYLKSVRLPEGLESIEAYAFGGCSYLKEITIPSGVTHIGKKVFAHCYALKTIKNLSGQTCDLETARGKITWRVGKKKVTEVSAGQTATSTGRKYKLTYVLNGGKMKQKTKTSYQYGEHVKLPKPKKKGYMFLGWSIADDTEIFLDTVLGEPIRGNLELYAVFKKTSIKKIKGRKIKVTVKPANTRLVVQYDTQKDLDKGAYYEGGTYYESTVGTIVVDKNDDGEVVTKKMKKGKTYYLRWGLICEMEERTRWFKTKKIKM